MRDGYCFISYLHKEDFCCVRQMEMSGEFTSFSVNENDGFMLSVLKWF